MNDNLREDLELMLTMVVGFSFGYFILGPILFG